MFPPPLGTGEAATLVIGQTDFTSSGSGTTATTMNGVGGISFDKKGNLWVADVFNNRVLRYKSPLSTGEAATLVIGQDSFTSSGSGTTATTLNEPDGAGFDANGNLWVAAGNNRVLMYP
jgi:sugar lactone lactonase YvrE